MKTIARKQQKKKTGGRTCFDWTLVFVVLFLCLFGLLMIYSSSYYTSQLKFDGYGMYYVRQQAKMLLLGLGAMIFFTLVPYSLWANLWWLGAGGVTLLMILVNFTSFGIELNGQKRWFGIGGHSLFQPVEIVKLSTILCVAVIVAANRQRMLSKHNIQKILFCTAPAIVLVAMNNLSSGIILCGIVFVMFYVACRERRFFLILIAIAIVAALIGLMSLDLLLDVGILKAYQVSRIVVWQNPEQYSQSGGWQVLQALYAIASGGFFGKGLGNGVQKLGSVPEASNDMIFAIICEELGLFGAVCLMLLFLFLLYRFLLIASNAPDKFGFMLVVGVMAQIGLQVILNIAVVCNVIPNTGVSLPFVSFGGTSLIFLLAEVGLVLSVSLRIRVEE